MRNWQIAASMAAGVLVLAACSTIGPAPAGGAGGGGGGGGGGATGAPNPPTGAVGIGAPGTISGSFSLKATKHSEDPTVQGVIDDSLEATVNVQMKRDASAPGEAYVDNGSTYTVKTLTKTSRLVGDCTATSETVADAAHAFTDQPTSIPNNITATIDRGSKSVLFFVSFSWIYNVTGNACDGRQPFTGENGISAACPIFGLTAKLTEDNGFDRIDTACVLPGGEAYAGLLTLTR